MRHAIPLLAGGAPNRHILAINRAVNRARGLLQPGTPCRVGPRIFPKKLVGKTLEEQEQWPGNEDFPLEPVTSAKCFDPD